MTPTTGQAHGSNHCANSTEAAQREERFYQAVAKLRAVHESLAEIKQQYPEFWEFLRDGLRDQLDPANQIPDGMDLETWALQRGAQPLSAFIHELEQIP